jgi:hypothetical protein
MNLQCEIVRRNIQTSLWALLQVRYTSLQPQINTTFSYGWVTHFPKLTREGKFTMITSHISWFVRLFESTHFPNICYYHHTNLSAQMCNNQIHQITILGEFRCSGDVALRWHVLSKRQEPHSQGLSVTSQKTDILITQLWKKPKLKLNTSVTSNQGTVINQRSEERRRSVTQMQKWYNKRPLYTMVGL